MVLPTPLSLATTRGISVDFFSSPYLDVSVREVPYVTLWIHVTFHGYSPWGFPHSEICGSKLICSSPWLIAACRVLLRLLMPRHSPCALIRLNFFIDLDLYLFSELLEFHKQIFIGIHIAVKRFILFPTLNHFHLSVKLYLPIFGKTKFILTIANLKVILSSKSVRFYSSISLFGFQ